MLRKNVKVRRMLETLTIFRRSLIYQTKEFFQNSTLHGVRYIAETGRPIGEKFMWFCFTSIGAITALVIIMSLWEKFQTNPTITGLDTDFHNQNVIFPTTVVCPDAPFDHEKAYDVAYTSLANYNHSSATMAAPFLEVLTTLSFDNIKEARVLAESISGHDWNHDTLRQWAFKAHISCEATLVECKYRDDTIADCCTHFDAVYTEHGFCFAFNSRFKSLDDADEKATTPHDLYETDKKWALWFVPNVTAKIYIFAYEEYFGRDFNAQIEWEEQHRVEVRISKKSTYTTDDARQLTIGQRKCIFNDEVQLKYFPGDYTYSSCMKECRMKKAIKLCKCNPPFYRPIQNVRMCNVHDLDCLDTNKLNITDIKDCMHCELSCSKTVYTIEKLSNSVNAGRESGVLVEFLTWPILRYKREVLFGWVDLLVSFGGIASLFLGFSLLSGVEIIYYFTLRAACMVYKNRQELYEMEENIKRRPPPLIDLSLKPHLSKPKLNVLIDHNTRNNLNLNNSHLKVKAINLNKRNNLQLNVPTSTDESDNGRRRKMEKNFKAYSKLMYKSVKVTPQYSDPNWQYGEYIP